MRRAHAPASTALLACLGALVLLLTAACGASPRVERAVAARHAAAARAAADDTVTAPRPAQA
jgi:uncharacterized lipoprotein